MNVKDLIGATIEKVHGGVVDECGDVNASVIRVKLADGKVVRVTAEWDKYKSNIPFLEIG